MFLRLRKDKVPGPGSQKSNKKVYFLLLAYGLVLCTGLGSLLRYPSPLVSAWVHTRGPFHQRVPLIRLSCSVLMWMMENIFILMLVTFAALTSRDTSPAVPEQLPPPGQVFHQGQLTAPAPIQFVINMPENGARRGRSPPRDFDPDLFQLLRSAMRRRDF